MNFEQKHLLMYGSITLLMVGSTALAHFAVGNILILALGWTGMFFMIVYAERIYIRPLIRDIGRLEGERKAYVKYRVLFGEIHKILMKRKKKK